MNVCYMKTERTWEIKNRRLIPKDCRWSAPLKSSKHMTAWSISLLQSNQKWIVFFSFDRAVLKYHFWGKRGGRYCLYEHFCIVTRLVYLEYCTVTLTKYGGDIFWFSVKGRGSLFYHPHWGLLKGFHLFFTPLFLLQLNPTYMKRILHLVPIRNIVFKSSYDWFKFDILRLLRPLTAN